MGMHARGRWRERGREGGIKIMIITRLITILMMMIMIIHLQIVNSSSRETEKQKEAKKCKESGNKHFSKGEYGEALEWFTKAIDLATPDTEGQGSDARKQLAIYHNNRAAARWNLATGCKKESYKDEVLDIVDMEQADLAVEDTTKAIKLDYRYVKARLCRAKVYEAKGEVKLAYDDYKRGMSYEPNNAQCRSGMDRLQPKIDELAEAKLVSITIPDVIPENRVIKYHVPGHGMHVCVDVCVCLSVCLCACVCVTSMHACVYVCV
jgi:tetratricopeptide (TPR) repeat protein